jgi:hypothetical protein
MKKLRIWWIPQVPGKAFHVEVKTLEEAHLILETLAQYDDFQYKNRIKPDYSNAGGLQMWDEDSDGEGTADWIEWMDNETGETFDEYRGEHFSPINFVK